MLALGFESVRLGWNRFLPRAKHDGLIFAGLYFFASALYLVETRNLPHRALPVADALYYVQVASNLSWENWGEVAGFSLSRLYVLYLAAVFHVAGGVAEVLGRSIRPLDFVAFSHALACALAVGITVWIAGRLSRASGIIAGVILLGFGPLYFFQGVAVPVALAAALGAVGVALFAFSCQVPRAGYLAVSAICLGLAVDLRPHFLFLVPVLAIALLTRRSVAALKARVGRAGTFLAISLFPTVLISLVFSLSSPADRTPIRSSAGLNLYIGNHRGATGLYRELPEINNQPQYFQESSKRYAEAETGRSLEASEVNVFWAKKALAFYTSEPYEALKLLGKKIQHLFSYKEFPLNYDYAVQRHYSKILQFLVINFGIILPLAVCYLVVGGQSAFERAIGLWFAAYAATLLILFVASDHRVPLIGATAVLAAAMLVKIGRDVRSRAHRDLLLAGVGIIGVGWFGMSDRTEWSHHLTYHQMGEMALTAGNEEMAMEAFRAAVQEEPAFFPSIEMLARIRFQRREYREAARWYQRASGLRPSHRRYWEGLAASMHCSGDPDGALRITRAVPDLDSSWILRLDC